MPDQETPNRVADVRLIEDYLADLEWRRLARTTIDIRRTYLTKVNRELGSFAKIKPKHLRRWLADPDRGLAASSQSVLLTAIHSFYVWAIKSKRLKKDPTLRVDKPKVKKGEPHAITDEHKEKALCNPDALMRCWLSLGCLAGCRCKEIAFMRREDIDAERMTLYIANGKGDKTRYVPLHPVLLEALTDWGMPAAGRLWDLTAQQMSKAINAYLHGIDARRNDGLPATAHCLRHWYGSTLYQMTKDIVLVKNLLGHASVATTQIYAGADMSKSAEWVGKL